MYVAFCCCASQWQWKKKTRKCYARTMSSHRTKTRKNPSYCIFYTNVDLNKEISSIDVPKAKRRIEKKIKINTLIYTHRHKDTHTHT